MANAAEFAEVGLHFCARRVIESLEDTRIALSQLRDALLHKFV
jgi:hypothetical protein